MKLLSLSSLLIALSASCAVILVAIGGALLFGGPTSPPAMAAINDPFKTVDFSDMPQLSHYRGTDDSPLAYRYYKPASSAVKGSVVLVHGSSASSNSMHVLAKALSSAGFATYSLDMRGHGNSGPKGTISYVGQLEDDIDSFTHAVALAKPSTLAGFSSGGGFVLRFAGSRRQDEFQNYLLLSPFLGANAPNYRPDSGGWVNVGIPRLLAINVLNRVGIHAFNDMAVTSFALNDAAKAYLTPEYSFLLASNFQPQMDYEQNIRDVHKPCAVVAGMSDEAFFTDRLESTFRKLGKSWHVTLLPGVGHIPLTLEPVAIKASINAIEDMQSSGGQ